MMVTMLGKDNYPMYTDVYMGADDSSKSVSEWIEYSINSGLKALETIIPSLSSQNKTNALQALEAAREIEKTRMLTILGIGALGVTALVIYTSKKRKRR